MIRVYRVAIPSAKSCRAPITGEEGQNSETDAIKSQSHPRHLVGKRTAQKDAIKGITSDSQVNSYFPYRWFPASLTINIYFHLFLYLYITIITINNGTPHLKSLKSQKQKSRLGTASNKIAGGLQLVFGRSTLALSSALVPQTLSCSVCVEDS